MGDNQNKRETYKTVVIQDESLRKFQGGFTAVPNIVLRDSSMSIGARMTYAMLLHYAWQDRFCYPAQESIANDLGITSRSVRTFLKELKESGLIDWKQQGLNRPNIYHILKLPTPTPSSNNSGAENFSAPEWKPASGQERKQASDYKDSITNTQNNVNVFPLKIEGTKTPIVPDPRREDVVNRIAERLGDTKQGSRTTFHRILDVLGEPITERLVGNTLEAYRAGTISSTRAKYFIGIVKKVAGELDKDLGFKTTGSATTGLTQPEQTSIRAQIATLTADIAAQTPERREADPTHQPSHEPALTRLFDAYQKRQGR